MSVTAELRYLHCGRLHNVIPCKGEACTIEQHLGNRAAVTSNDEDPLPHRLVDHQRLSLIGIIRGKQENIQLSIKAILIRSMHRPDVAYVAGVTQQLLKG